MVINSSGKSLFEIHDSTGKEFKEIYDNQGRLIFKNWSEISGVPPLNFTSRGDYLKDYRIYGNTVQDGTPTPENPVEVVGCGVRTVQLFEDKIVDCNINDSGNLIRRTEFDMYLAKVEQGVTYTASDLFTGGFFAAKPEIGSTSYDGRRIVYAPPTFTAPITGYVIYLVDSGSTVHMLNLGSTALPYEPYGYKIPVTVSDGTNSIITPVYIGSEPLHKIGDYADYVDFQRGVVVRRIKKLVLTGDENFIRVTNGTFYEPNIVNDYMHVNINICVSTHYISQKNASGTSQVNNNNVAFHTETMYNRVYIKDTRFETSNDFTSFLSAQYEAGTPVTIWYVLAEPEEEPLENLSPIQTIKGTNILTADTTVQPSEIYIKYKR